MNLCGQYHTEEQYYLGKRRCTNKRIMYNMEYTSSVFNIFIGIVCVGVGIYGWVEKKQNHQN
jgi:hypothetical protein